MNGFSERGGVAWSRRGGAEAPFLELWGEPGAFTTLRIIPRSDAGLLRREEGSPQRRIWVFLALDAHIERLNRDLRAAGIEPVAQGSIKALLRTAEALLEAPGDPAAEMLLRISATTDWLTAALRPAVACVPSVRGVLFHHERTEPERKHLHYAPLLEQIRRSDRLREEVLLVDREGQLRETCTANLIAEDFSGRWFSPARDCLPGLTRQFLGGALGESVRWLDRDLSIDSLSGVAALWCCGTGRMVCAVDSIPELGWVSAIDRTTLNMRAEALQQRLRDYLCNHVASRTFG